MSHDWLPKKDVALRDWASTASALMNVAPTTWGQTALATQEFVDRAAAFDAAMANIINPETRGHMAYVAKAQARAALVSYVRPLIKEVQASQIVTNTMREQLGIPVHRTEPSRAQVIDVEPLVEVERVDGRKVYLRISDGTGTHRSKLPQASGVYVFTATGTVMPTDPAAYAFQGGSGKTFEKIVVPGADATTLFVCAQWWNSQGPGPGSNPIAINIAAAPAIPSAKPLKMAA